MRDRERKTNNKVIRGPWKPRDYDPAKDPEFYIPPTVPTWVIRLIAVVVVLLLSILIMK